MIPVVVLAGFLGAGKTTLLNHLLRNRAGVRVGVLVNDFGAINVDAMSVDAAVDSTISLGNGCICCAADTEDVDDMLLRFTDPEPKVDVIIVEASGLAEPQSVVRMILASDNRALEYGGLIEVVDAVEFADTLAEHPVLRRHLAFADLVLLNKKDQVDAAAITRLRAIVAECAPGAPVVPTEYGAIDPRLLLDGQERPVAQQLSFADLDDDHSEHLHAGYTSTEFVSAQPLDPRALLEFFSTHSADIYRIKGFVYFGIPGHEHKFTVHTVGRHLRFHRGEWASEERRDTQLVLIGAGLQSDAILKELAECVHAPRAAPEPDAMLPIYRHTRS